MSRDSVKMNSQLPRRIWILWLQGSDAAPDLVRACIHSWIIMNPTWSVTVLDSESVEEYVDLRALVARNSDKITMQKISNLIRINLLATYGGVWADATTLCLKPLDDWLHENTRSGFFAFRSNEPDRILANYFMASTPNCYLIKKFSDEHNKFWQSHRFFGQRTALGFVLRKGLNKLLNRRRETTRWWVSPNFVKLLGIYPYFIFHYHFRVVVLSDDRAAAIWKDTPCIERDINKLPGHMQLTPEAAGFANASIHEIIELLKKREAPLYKLNWREDRFAPSPDSAIALVLRYWRDQPLPSTSQS